MTFRAGLLAITFGAGLLAMTFGGGAARLCSGDRAHSWGDSAVVKG